VGSDSVQSFAVSAPASLRPPGLLPAAAVAVAVLAGFAALLCLSRSYAWSGPASGEPYNLAVEGFHSGHLWLAKEAPAPLVRAANPYAFATYRRFLGPPWNLVDLSYYRGHLYAYFGVTPAVILFWPYRALTGGFLHQAYGVLAFCALGYAVSVGLAAAAWRRYFPGAGAWAFAAVALLLGTVTTLPVFLVRPGLFEVSISCGYFLTMLSLAALWNAWHARAAGAAWLALASLLYGLAVGARPTLLFGALLLALPVAAAFMEERRTGLPSGWPRLLAAALLPISAVGAGLASYNFARFGNPLELGTRYMLTGVNLAGMRAFGLRFVWDNVRVYVVEPLRWHAGFPFVWEPARPPLVAGHLTVEFFFGVLATFPVLLCVALGPLSWKGARRGRPLSRIASALALLCALEALPIFLYACVSSRYLLDFLPALALLAALGILGLEDAVGGNGAPEEAGRPPLRASVRGTAYAQALRLAVCGALAFSVASGWLLAIALSGFYRGAEQGVAALNAGRTGEAIAVLERVCGINPDFRGRAEMLVGTALLGQGRASEGAVFLSAAARDQPDLEAAHLNLGRALLEQGRLRESEDSLWRAAALDPLDSEAEAYLGVALFRDGRTAEAIEREKAALAINPDLGEARDNLRTFESPESSAGRP
jgi:Flp pilus assembly protein TadD